MDESRSEMTRVTLRIRSKSFRNDTSLVVNVITVVVVVVVLIAVIVIVIIIAVIVVGVLTIGVIVLTAVVVVRSNTSNGCSTNSS